MKKAIALIACIFVLLLNIPVGHSASGISECPDIRVVIDGKQQTFSTIPLKVNDRTMLPVRDILTSLGTRNENIIWDDTQKSVTAYKEDVKVMLKVGSNIAYVNDTPVELDAEPVNYKNRVFIPVRFVSDNFGKKVVWDEATKTVFIREAKEFVKTKELLEKINSAMETVKRYKFETAADILVASRSFELTGYGEIDLVEKIMHMNMGILVAEKEIKTETYLAKNAVFSRTLPQSQWKKNSISSEQYDKLLQGGFILKDRLDMLAAGLVLQQDYDYEKITMMGDVFIDDVFSQSAEIISVFGIEFNKMNLELTVDKNSFLLKSAAVNADAAVKTSSGTQPVTERISCTYSGYNENFIISLPYEIK